MGINKKSNISYHPSKPCDLVFLIKSHDPMLLEEIMSHDNYNLVDHHRRRSKRTGCNSGGNHHLSMKDNLLEHKSRPKCQSHYHFLKGLWRLNFSSLSNSNLPHLLLSLSDYKITCNNSYLLLLNINTKERNHQMCRKILQNCVLLGAATQDNVIVIGWFDQFFCDIQLNQIHQFNQFFCDFYPHVICSPLS